MTMTARSTRKFLLGCVTLLFGTALLFDGCGIWTDTTTYFNLYWNISSLYEEAEKTILEQRKDLFQFIEPDMPTQLQASLKKIIEKCSNLLQFHNTSSYVDETLLILGKCFYYQKNYLQASRKFSELLATQKESPNILEAQLWLARIELQSKNYKVGLELLQAVKDTAIVLADDEILKESFMTEIRYYIFDQQYERAIGLTNELLALSSDKELNAKLMFQIGNMYFKLGDIAAASDAFSRVKEYSPDFDLEFRAALESAKMLRESGDNEGALVLFEEMEQEQKFTKSKDMIFLELGITKRNLGLYDDAYENFKSVDTGYANSLYAGAARYELAEMFEENLGRYDSALFYYNRAKLAPTLEDYVKPINRKQKVLAKYDQLRTALLDYEKQIFYLQYPDSFLKDSIYYYTEVKRLKDEEELAKLFAGTVNSVGSDTLFYELDSTFTAADTYLVRVDMTVFAGDTTFYRKDSTSLADTREKERVDKLNPKNTTIVENPLLKLKAPIRPVISEDSLRITIIKNEFEMGNLFFGDMNRADSAFVYYSTITQNYPETRLTPQVLFSLASYYSTVQEDQKADSLFNFIYDNYKTNPIVNAAAEKIQKPVIDLTFDPAEDAFLEAEILIAGQKYDSALTKLNSVYTNYPKSDFAAKSLYTMAFILEEYTIDNDSAAAVYNMLSMKYPKTEYTKKIAPKLTTYKQEQQRIEKERQDSINAEKLRVQVMQDSLAAINEVEAFKRQIAIDDSLEALRKMSPDSLQQNLPDSLQQNLPDSLQQNLPDSLKQSVPDSVNTQNSPNPIPQRIDSLYSPNNQFIRPPDDSLNRDRADSLDMDSTKPNIITKPKTDPPWAFVPDCRRAAVFREGNDAVFFIRRFASFSFLA